jgi:hypothetical protein
MTGKTGEARLRDLLLLTSMRDRGRISDALIEIDLVDRSAEIFLFHARAQKDHCQ